MSTDRPPSFPPTFSVDFEGEPACNASLTIKLGAWTDTLDVVSGERAATFVYRGPRVPVLDSSNRLRTFEFTGPGGYSETASVQMPVERMVTGLGAVEVSYSFTPTLDIDNQGNVVFDSNDEAALSTQSPGDIIFWPIDPGSEIERFSAAGPSGTTTDQLASAAISDEGTVIAFIKRTPDVDTFHFVNRDTGDVIRDVDPDLGASFSRRLDVRGTHDTANGYRMLAHTERGTDGDENVMVEIRDTGSLTGLSNVGAPGLLFPDGGAFSYSALVSGGAGTVATAFRETETIPSDGCPPRNDTRVRATNARMALDFVYVCNANNKLHVGGMEYDVPLVATTGGLVDASDDLSLVLLHDRVDLVTASSNAYVLFTPGGPAASLILNEAGERVSTRVEDGFRGAAISPNGEWAAYAIIAGTPGDKRMQIFRVPTRNEIPLTAGP